MDHSYAYRYTQYVLDFHIIRKLMLIFMRVDVFGALGYPEIDDAPAMRCKLGLSHQFIVACNCI